MDESTESVASTVEPAQQPAPAPAPEAVPPVAAPAAAPAVVLVAAPAAAPVAAPAPVAHKPHRSIGGAIGVFFLFGIVALAVRNLLTLFFFDVNPTSGALLTVILALIVAIKWKLEKSKRIGASLVRVAVAGIGWGLILFLFFLNVQLLLYGVVTADQLTAAAQAAAASPDAGGAVFGWILKAIAVIAGFISKFISAAWVCEMLAIVVIQFVLIAIVCIICYFIDDTSSYFLPLFLGICVFVVFIVGINTGSTSGLMKVMSVLVS